LVGTTQRFIEKLEVLLGERGRSKQNSAVLRKELDSLNKVLNSFDGRLSILEGPAAASEAILLYGAETLDQVPTQSDVPIKVTFGSPQGANDDPVILDADGTLRMNMSVPNRVTVSINVSRTGMAGIVRFGFRPVLDGVPITKPKIVTLDNRNTVYSGLFFLPFSLPPGSIFHMDMMRDSSGSSDGGLYTQEFVNTDWDDVPSAEIFVTAVS
jgi:hypothetical protein